MRTCVSVEFEFLEFGPPHVLNGNICAEKKIIRKKKLQISLQESVEIFVVGWCTSMVIVIAVKKA